jgi:type I restriction enzyme M protein
MSEEQRRQLQQQLWNIANTLRGKMGADEFRDYILGFIFYKYLSEKIQRFADEQLESDGIQFVNLNENDAEGAEIIEAVKEEALAELGYFLKPSELFHAIADKGNSKTESDSFIIEDLIRIFNLLCEIPHPELIGLGGAG